MAKLAAGLSKEMQREVLSVMAGRLHHLWDEVANGRLRMLGAQWHEEGVREVGGLERTKLVFEAEWVRED